MSMQRLQSQPSGHGWMRQRHDGEQTERQRQRACLQNLRSVSGFQDGAKEIDPKKSNFPMGLGWHGKEIDQYLKSQVNNKSLSS